MMKNKIQNRRKYYQFNYASKGMICNYATQLGKILELKIGI